MAHEGPPENAAKKEEGAIKPPNRRPLRSATGADAADAISRIEQLVTSGGIS